MNDTRPTLEPWDVEATDVPPAHSPHDRIPFLLRFALLAPSSHNSQPWRFRWEDGQVELRPDLSRWLRVADADRRELHLSLGCAVENLLVASRRFGHDPTVDVGPGPDGEPVVRVALGPADHEPDPAERLLFDAIPRRRTHHGELTDRPLEPSLVTTFERACTERGVRLHVVRDPDTREAVAELQRRADVRQMGDRSYREELGEWIGSGLLGDSGLRARIGKWVVTHVDLGDRQGSDNAAALREAPLVGVLLTAGDDAATRVRAGQAWERLALTATAAGVATQPLSQILEVAELKEELGDRLGSDADVPQHLFRAGYAAEEGKHTPRWPLDHFVDG